MFKMHPAANGRRFPLGAFQAQREDECIRLFVKALWRLSQKAGGLRPEAYRIPSAPGAPPGLRILLYGWGADLDDLISDYGSAFALIHARHPLSISGLVNGGEEGCIDFETCGGQSVYTKSSSTGRDFDAISHLSFDIRLTDTRQSALLESLLRAMGGAPWIALTRRWDTLPLAGKLFEPIDGCCYRYLYLCDETPYPLSAIPGALTLAQLVRLWQSFLCDHAPWYEFSLAAGIMDSGGLDPLYKWQIGLKLALDKQGISVSFHENRLLVRGIDGQPLSLGIGHNAPDAAGVLMAKLIFPA